MIDSRVTKLFSSLMSSNMERRIGGLALKEEALFAPKLDNALDTFIRTTNPIKETASVAKAAADEWKSLIPALDSKITPANFIGSGGSARVYGLNDKYVLRLSHGETAVGGQKLSPVKDIFEGRNFGQAVAESENGYVTINQFVPGKRLYKINEVYKDKNFDPESYMKNLREYSNLPDATLEQLVDDVAFINKKGYRIDQSNPENFLYDRKTGKIGIVDICKKHSSSLDLSEPYASDWILNPLVNAHDLSGIYEKLTPAKREEMFNLIKKLEDRVLPLCEKHGIPKTKWNTEDYDFDYLASILESRGKIDFNNDDLLRQVIEIKFPHLKAKFKLA